MAVALNLTATDGAAPGYVTAWTCGDPVPGTSVLNFTPGHAVPNLVVLKIGAGGLCFSSSASVDLIGDLAGWFDSASFRSAVPARLLDTRAEGAPLPANAERRISVAPAGLSADTSAVAINVTVTQPAADGYVTAYPCGTSPDASTVNFRRGEEVATLTLVTVSGTDVCVWSSVPTHLVVDSFGAISDSGDVRVKSPARVFDTRQAPRWPYGPAQSTSKLTVHVAGRGGIPTNAAAALLTVTAVDGSGDGYVTVWPCDSAMPATSTLNLWAGVVRSNATLVDLADNDGSVCLRAWTSNHSPIHVVVDAVGWVTGGPDRPAPPAQPIPPTPTTFATPLAAPGDIAALPSQVGPRPGVVLVDRAGGQLPCGTYAGVRFTSKVVLTDTGCAYTFVDSALCVDSGGPGKTINVAYSHVTCGWYFENGSHGGVTIERSLVTDACVGLRPQGATNGRSMEVVDTVISVSGTPSAGAHCEAMASFTNAGGLTSNVHVTRSRLIVQRRWDGSATPNTGIINMTGTDIVFTDSVFGDPSQPKPAYYMIYQSGVSLIRPRLYPGAAGVWYAAPPRVLDSPVYL